MIIIYVPYCIHDKLSSFLYYIWRCILTPRFHVKNHFWCSYLFKYFLCRPVLLVRISNWKPYSLFSLTIYSFVLLSHSGLSFLWRVIAVFFFQCVHFYCIFLWWLIFVFLFILVLNITVTEFVLITKL